MLPAARFSKSRTEDVVFPLLRRGRLPSTEDLEILEDFPHAIHNSSGASRVATEGGAPTTRTLSTEGGASTTRTLPKANVLLFHARCHEASVSCQ